MLHVRSTKMLEEQQASIPKPESSTPKPALSQEHQDLLHAPQTAARKEQQPLTWLLGRREQWLALVLLFHAAVKSVNSALSQEPGQTLASPMATSNPPWWVLPAANPSFANTVLSHTSTGTFCRLNVFQELHATQPCAKLFLLQQEHLWSKSSPCKKQTPIISILLFLTAACTWKSKSTPSSWGTFVCSGVYTQFIRKSGGSFPFPLSLLIYNVGH